ncbi:MAG: hypothetical protein M1820_007741 [Bogoriella megaspora]|nr:MAG: hypothetical protein M1820_007741 [Bogoriella megaspora]
MDAQANTESYESTSPLNEATKAAIEKMAQKEIEAVLPRMLTAIKERLVAEMAQQQHTPESSGVATAIEDHSSRNLDTTSSSGDKGKADTSPKIFPPVPPLKDLIALLLNWDEHVCERDVPDWGRKVLRHHTAPHEPLPFKIGVCGSVEYGIVLDGADDWGEGYCFRPIYRHREYRRYKLSDYVRVICRLDEELVVSHSSACLQSTTGDSFDNDIGRTMRIGGLYCREAGHRWRPVRFSVRKSLTEGGLWVTAARLVKRDGSAGVYEDDARDDSDSDDSRDEVFIDDYDECLCKTPRTHLHSLPGVGQVTIARLPDSVSSRLLEANEMSMKEYNTVRRLEDAVVGDGHVPDLADIQDSRMFEFQHQYSGEFVLSRPLRLCEVGHYRNPESLAALGKSPRK